jgi:hypothetical protein
MTAFRALLFLGLLLGGAAPAAALVGAGFVPCPPSQNPIPTDPADVAVVAYPPPPQADVWVREPGSGTCFHVGVHP